MPVLKKVILNSNFKSIISPQLVNFSINKKKKMTFNPSLLEVNTRVWLKQFAPGAKLSDINDSFIEDIKNKGIGILWLMGIWRTSKVLVNKCCKRLEKK